jgi:hypothetical protein
MFSAEDLESLKYQELIDVLGKLTKEYTSALADHPNRLINDNAVYRINLLIKEIKIIEEKLNNSNLDLSY